MYDLFFQKLNDKVSFTAEEQAIISSYLTTKKLRKKQYLLQEGDICKTIAFVQKGALRAYSVNEKGVENILQFALEGLIISDLYSFMTGETASYNIDALEDSEVILITQKAQEELFARVPKYETYSRMLITGAYLAMQKRITSLLSLSLEERYLNFINLYPNMVQRVPQHMIASYLGLTPETVSRIRKRLAAK